MSKRTAIVIGGGHNGLVAAITLAKAGRQVTLIEARPSLGGLAGVEDLAGIEVPVAAHLAYGFSPKVAKALGLSIAAPALKSFALDGKGGALALDGVPEAAALREKLLRFAGTLAPFQELPPPSLVPKTWREKLTLARLGLRLRLLGAKQMSEFLRMALMPVQDVLDDELQNDLLKGALANEALLGSYLAPRSPGGVLAWLYRLAGEASGAAPLAPLTGDLLRQLESKARAAGVTILCGVAVSAIDNDGQSVSGVTLADGRKLDAGLILSSLDVKATLLGLLSPDRVEIGLRRAAKHHRAKGLVGKLDLIADGAVTFSGAGGEGVQRLIHAPSLSFIEEAFDHAKYGDLAPAFPLEIVRRPLEGKTHLSILINHVPAEADGEEVTRRVLVQLEKLAPGLGAKITAQRLSRPGDFARSFGVAGGHWHHGEITIDQFFMMRPIPGIARYRLPLRGLYLAGAAAHPGGNVTGLPGWNAARAALRGKR